MPPLPTYTRQLKRQGLLIFHNPPPTYTRQLMLLVSHYPPPPTYTRQVGTSWWGWLEAELVLVIFVEFVYLGLGNNDLVRDMLQHLFT